PRAQEFEGFLDEVAQGHSAALVSGRDNLDYRDDPAEMVPDHDTVGPVRVEVPRRAANDARTRSTLGRHAAVSLPPRRILAAFDGQYVRFEGAGALLDQGGKAFGQAARVQRIRDADAPTLMKMVKQPCWHAGPVVDRHGKFSPVALISSRIIPYPG